MSTETPNTQRGIANQPPQLPRHTKEDALSEREFELLLEGTYEMKPYYGFQARFIVLVGGRLGLRRGEISHMRESWIDWRRNMIEIPRREPCQKGKSGGVCGYCRSLAEQRVEHAEDEEDGITMEQALAETWRPKTEAAIREVPFDHDARAQLVIERFFDQYDAYPCSSQSLNRRVKKAAEHADELDPSNVYPHCLRATAATMLASKGFEVIPMKSMMGWSKFDTAQSYIAESGENTQRALHSL